MKLKITKDSKMKVIPMEKQQKCPACDGGQTIRDSRNDSDRECPTCKGTGYVKEEE